MSVSDENASSASTSKNEDFVFKCDDHANTVLKKLQTFYNKHEFFDIVLIAGIDDSSEQAHRVVLSAASDYFLAMFRSTLQDANAHEVRLENLDGATLRLVLNFMYTAKIELNSNIVETVVMAADFLQLNTLIGACCDFMGDQLEPSNCLGVALFAELHSYTTLFEKAIAYVYANFGNVCKEVEFMKLDEKQLIKLLFSEDICANSHELVFNSLVAWVEHDKENRKQSTYKLLSRVHFTLLTPEFIIESIEPVCETVECFKLVHMWLKWHYLPQSRSQITQKFPVEGEQRKKLAFHTGTSDFQIQTYDAEKNEWSYEKWPMPLKKRIEYGTVLIGDKLFIAGGKQSGQITNSVEYLDLNTMQWCELPPMALARRWPGMAELNGHLYVVGGESAGNWSCSVEIFDFSTRIWTYSEPLRLSLSFIQVLVLSDNLYAVGNGQRTIERYDPVTVKWTTTSPKEENSLNFGIAAVNGKVYAVGGDFNGIKCETVECYDPAANSWTVAKSLGLGRLYVKCSALEDRLIACVGYNDLGEWCNLVEEYDPQEDEWKALAPLLPHDFSISSRLFLL
ncbi:kelch-like protein 5 [Eupeodes corollae]|uniref:kelch-like protein 5 n=1 Tax=Eupeodes corollae TaxID=290404 RepID=UPI00248FD288|nr:kelch-like protein 5 [Eupeodes corollae]XP_055905164.1 kelch-like protein 5 [Eupeodes corollae]